MVTVAVRSPLLLLIRFEFRQYLLLQKKKLEEERNGLRKEVVALRIMQANYEQMVKAQQIPIGHVETRIPDEEKFQMVITAVMRATVDYEP